jgi:hypothetical protein
MSETPDEAAGRASVVWPDDALWPQGGYANVIVVNHTPWDFTLRLGHVVLPYHPPGTAPEGGVEIIATPVAQVTMPPAALRQLAIVLQEQVARYMANYGDIGGPPPDQGIGR